MSGSRDGAGDETLSRFFERRQQFFNEIDALRTQAGELWEKYRAEGVLTMTEVALLEGIRQQRQEVFNAYQADEERFIDLVLKRRTS